MPYKNRSDLPKTVRDHLPVHAQEIYFTAFNTAFKEYKDPKNDLKEARKKKLPIKLRGQLLRKSILKKRRSGKK